MTDISNRAIIPQVNEPLGYVDGKPLYPTVAWQQFLDALWKRTGGFRDSLYDEVIRSLVEASETRGALASVESLTRALESLAQANDADIRQAIEASRQEALSRIDDARAQTLSSALELIEAARREIRAEAESTRAEVQSALAALGELARRDFVSSGELDAQLVITDSGGQPVLDRPQGKLFVGGYELYRTFSQSGTGSVFDAHSTGRVLRRLDLIDVRARNSWATFSSLIEFGSHGTGTMTSGDTATFRLELWISAPGGTVNPGGNFASVTASPLTEVIRWTIVMDHLGALTITNQANNTVTVEQLNQALAGLNINFPSGMLGNAHVYLVGRWISTTAASSTGIVLQFDAGTTITTMALINVTP
jgi:F0F1-type ATP synthase membrane subunit b/b'